MTNLLCEPRLEFAPRRFGARSTSLLPAMVMVGLSVFCASCSVLNEPRFGCNPVFVAGDSGCDSNEKCVVVEDPQAQATECRKNTGNSTVGIRCANDEDCTTALACVTTTSSSSPDGLCRFVCRVGVESDCQIPVLYDGPYECAPAKTSGWAQFGFCCPRSGC